MINIPSNATSTNPRDTNEKLIASVNAYIQKQQLIQQNSTIVVGLSGGPDSACLLSILKNLQQNYGLTLIAVHIDHQWRSNSADDARFCEALAASLSLPFHCIKASEVMLTKKYNGSQEEMGRALRRQALESLSKEYNAHAIALAHHADDQQETFFLRMIRGASIAGLASMRPKQGIYIRPLLQIHKSDILDYLTKENLTYVVDSTNENDAFLRNALRHTVLPALKECDTRFDKNFFKTLAHIQQTDEFLVRHTARLFEEVTHTTDVQLWLNYEKLLAADPFMHHPLLIQWLCTMRVPFTPSTAFLNEIVRFFRNQSKTHVLTTTWIIEKNGSLARITSTPHSL